MRIAVIGPTYPFKGGISHFTTLLVKNFRKQYNVEFISWKRQYPSFLYPVELKDKQSKHPLTTQAVFMLDFFNPLTWFATGLYISKKNITVLYLTWVSPIQSPIYAIITYIVKTFSKTKVVYICHNVLPHEKSIFDIMLAKIAFSRSDGFVVHGKEDKKKLEKLVTNKQIVLGFHPIYDFFNTGQKIDILKVKKELQLGEKVILFFGYIRPYKGLKYLLQAMPELCKEFPDITLLVVGEFWSKDKQSYVDLIRELNIENNIVMINRYIPNEEVAKYFTVSDVVVLPYISATQSGISQIAHAFKKPVISTAVGGLKDAAENGEIDVVIKEHDKKDIVEKVKQFYKSKKDISIKTSSNTWSNYIKLISNTFKYHE